MTTRRLLRTRASLRPGEMVVLSAGVLAEVLTVRRSSTGVLVTVDLSGDRHPKPYSLGWARPTSTLVVQEDQHG